MIAGAVLALLPLASAHAMDVATFLAKADALQKKGMMALFSGDLKVLKAEIQESGTRLEAEIKAARAAGRRTAFCAPGDRAAINSNELLASFRTIPPAQRSHVQVKDALRTFLAHKYPCR
ncbi:MAG TPA: hypothetical protein VGC56_04465 [Allosphingosinicella sp.]